MTLPESHPLAHPELPAGIEPPPRPARRREAAGLPAWPAWAPLVAFLGAVLAALVASIVLSVGFEAAGVSVDPDDLPPGITIGATVVQSLGLAGFAILMAGVTAGRPSPRDFGIRRTAPWAAVRWTAAAWVAFMAFSALWSAALNVDETDDLPQKLGADQSTAALVAVLLMVTLLAPVAEELFFRGFLFTTLRRAIGALPAALLTGAIFGAIHGGGTDAVFLVPLGVFGFLLCLLYWKTDSLLPCMSLHALNNSLALGVTLGWPAWAVVLTIAGSVSVILAVGLVISRRAEPAPAPA